MNIKPRLSSKRLVYYLKTFIIVVALAFTLTVSASLFNKKSHYNPGDIKNVNDTGYTEYSSGWPERYYSYRTFMKNDKPVISNGEVNWNSFIIDMFFFSIPASVVFIAISNVLRNFVISSKKK